MIDRPVNVWPADQTDVFTATPTITWEAVDQATYYLVHIEGGVVAPVDHWSPTLGDTQYTLPAGLLAQDDSYELVVYAIREATGSEIDFYSSSRYLLDNIHFTVRRGDISATVRNVRDFDGSYYTYFAIEIDDAFVGTLPDDIDAITITGPSGSRCPIRLNDFSFDPPYYFYLIGTRHP